MVPQRQAPRGSAKSEVGGLYRQERGRTLDPEEMRAVRHVADGEFLFHRIRDPYDEAVIREHWSEVLP